MVDIEASVLIILIVWWCCAGLRWLGYGRNGSVGLSPAAIILIILLILLLTGNFNLNLLGRPDVGNGRIVTRDPAHESIVVLPAVT